MSSSGFLNFASGQVPLRRFVRLSDNQQNFNISSKVSPLSLSRAGLFCNSEIELNRAGGQSRQLSANVPLR